jgi:hypothetical protein
LTIRRLPREAGISIRCNHGDYGTDNPACEARHFTGNIKGKVNLLEATKSGWIRARVGHRSADLCPDHAVGFKEWKAALDAEILAAKKREHERDKAKRKAERERLRTEKKAAKAKERADAKELRRVAREQKKAEATVA